MQISVFQERTLVGGRSAKREQDIQLHGLGILPEHCVITIEESGLYMTPLNGARCFVNGTQVVNKTLLQHGDRIVWGNHHFFRVNCPRSATGAIQYHYIDFQLHKTYQFRAKQLRVNISVSPFCPQQSTVSRKLPHKTLITTLPGKSLCLTNFRTIRFREL